MARTLTRGEAKTFYDRFGARQDSQSFYEDRALDDLVAHAAFERAQHVFELGCGTGRFAAGLLASHLPGEAEYDGVDISTTMVALARERLAPFGPRARVHLMEGSDPFAGIQTPVDRIISSYVLDLLEESEIAAFIAGCARALRPGGLLCLVSLTFGFRPTSRVVTSAWRAVFRISPRLVGGCRPIELRRYLAAGAWRVTHHTVVSSFGVPSEVVVAEPRRTA
ncbi:MAG: class I SAM-dependent methyltransferase [Betaproteobacteria bacterium]